MDCYKRKDAQDELSAELTQEQTAHLDELIQLMREECDFGVVEAFKQGINYVNLRLVRWLMRTRKKVKRSWAKAQHLLCRIAMSSPEMFCHWKAGYMPVR